MFVRLMAKLHYIFDMKLGILSLMCTILHNLLFSVFVEEASMRIDTSKFNYSKNTRILFRETRCCKSCIVIKLVESEIIVLLSKGY